MWFWGPPGAKALGLSGLGFKPLGLRGLGFTVEGLGLGLGFRHPLKGFVCTGSGLCNNLWLFGVLSVRAGRPCECFDTHTRTRQARLHTIQTLNPKP